MVNERVLQRTLAREDLPAVGELITSLSPSMPSFWEDLARGRHRLLAEQLFDEVLARRSSEEIVGFHRDFGSLIEPEWYDRIPSRRRGLADAQLDIALAAREIPLVTAVIDEHGSRLSQEWGEDSRARRKALGEELFEEVFASEVVVDIDAFINEHGDLVMGADWVLAARTRLAELIDRQFETLLADHNFEPAAAFIPEHAQWMAEDWTAAANERLTSARFDFAVAANTLPALDEFIAIAPDDAWRLRGEEAAANFVLDRLQEVIDTGRPLAYDPVAITFYRMLEERPHLPRFAKERRMLGALEKLGSQHRSGPTMELAARLHTRSKSKARTRKLAKTYFWEEAESLGTQEGWSRIVRE